MAHFPPTRDAALNRLQAFAPHAGRAYAEKRNFDLGGDHPHVSTLSPYLRTRVLSEEEVLVATLACHSRSAAEKFIQEVYWRTYWKGWMEMRPSVWTEYRSGVKGMVNRLQSESGLRRDWEAACKGDTGIDCFDHWAKELVETGYLHNHARMWFASIWTFTLRLPWQLGADFFMRHLLDGDPASNTLGWRWVAGLQTIGKHYVAKSSNIAKFTEFRFAPGHDLAANPAPLSGSAHPSRGPVPTGDVIDPSKPSVVLLHDDDLHPDHIIGKISPKAVGICLRTAWRSPLEMGPNVVNFSNDAATDAASVGFGGDCKILAIEEVLDWANDAGATQIVVPFAPTGPNADMVHHLKHKARGLDVVAVMRSYDRAAWPHATHGFFKFKEKIPKLLETLPQSTPDLFSNVKHAS